jgi:hypothetical protein
VEILSCLNAAKQGVFDRLLDRFVLNAQARVVEPQ